MLIKQLFAKCYPCSYIVNDAVKQAVSEFGTKYFVDFDLEFENKTTKVRTAWLAENEDTIPRLITCYIKL